MADQLYSYDEGKVVAEQGKPPAFLHSIQTFDLPPTWKMDAAFLARELDLSTLSSARPISKATQRRWLLSAVLASEDAGGTPPAKHPDRRSKCPGWTEVVKEAQKAGLLEVQGGRLSLTREGREQTLQDDLFHPDGLPDDPHSEYTSALLLRAQRCRRIQNSSVGCGISCERHSESRWRAQQSLTQQSASSAD